MMERNQQTNPLDSIIDFCYCQTSLNYWRHDIQQFIRASCCQNTGFTGADYGNMLAHYRHLYEHIQSLHVLLYSYPDWKTSFNHPCYQLTVTGNFITIVDHDMKDDSTLKFSSLSKDEILNLQLFMRRFFEFKPLHGWLHTLDRMFEMVFSPETFAQGNPEAFKIFSFLEKLGEAIFLVYEIRGKEHLLAHHAEHYGIPRKKLVDA